MKIGRNGKLRMDNSEDWMDVIVDQDDFSIPGLNPPKKRMVKYIFFMMLFIIFIFSTRIYYINYIIGDDLRVRADQNHKRLIRDKALRGIIYDRNEEPLVQNIALNHLAIIPADIPRDDGKREELFRDLSQNIGMTYEEIYDKYMVNRFSFHPVILKRDISHDESIYIETKYGHIPSLFVYKDFKRDYIMDNDYAHIIGYISPITSEEYNELDDYSIDSKIGRIGIEEYFEDKLRGSDGKKIMVIDANGSLIYEEATEKASRGEDVYLTIDNSLQSEVVKILHNRMRNYNANAAAVVVMDPNTGDILSIASFPDFDPNIFSGTINQEEWGDIVNNKYYPFLNRAIGGIYPPGSVYKLVTSTAVLTENIVAPDDKILSPGSITIQDQFVNDKVYIYKDWKSSGHGYIDIKDALAESSDTFFYQVTGGYEDLKGLGIDNLVRFSSIFGLGNVLGVQLPGEKGGLLPDPLWKKETRDATWYTGDTYNMSIGQGYLLTTPLQVAQFTSVVANGGFDVKPTIIRSLEVQDNNRIFDDDVIKVVQEGMRKVITSKNGTAKSLQNSPIDIAGKTGTAQFETGAKEHAWFTAYAPYENPEIVVTVIVERVGEGGTYAMPIARDIIEWYLRD